MLSGESLDVRRESPYCRRVAARTAGRWEPILQKGGGPYCRRVGARTAGRWRSVLQKGAGLYCQMLQEGALLPSQIEGG